MVSPPFCASHVTSEDSDAHKRSSALLATATERKNLGIWRLSLRIGEGGRVSPSGRRAARDSFELRHS